MTHLYDFNEAVSKLEGEVTLGLRLIHYKNRHGQTYENRPCDIKIQHDVNRDGRCDTAFLFCLVELPFQNPHNCTLGDYFTGFVGADDIHFINIDDNDTHIRPYMQQRSHTTSLWFLPTIYFKFKYPKNGIGLIVEVFDVDDLQNQMFHDSIDFYGRTLLDIRLSTSKQTAQLQHIVLRSLFGSYTNLTVDFSLYCSENYYGHDCNTYCIGNDRYTCDLQLGKKLCNKGYFGQDCLSDLQACENNPCLHNGTCVVYLRDYVCQCSDGFTGRSCEIKVQTTGCNSSSCIHGRCSKNNKCICEEGWTSPNCNQSISDYIGGCYNNPCLHNSTCESLDNKNKSYQCHCRPTHTGKHCEVEILTTCERIPCVNGQCVKVGLYNEICICQPYWSGIDCTKPYIATTEKRRSVITNTLVPINLSAKRISVRSTTLKTTHIPSTFFPQWNRHRPTTSIKFNKSDDVKEYLDWLNEQYGDQLSAQILFPKTSIIVEHQYTTTAFNPYKHTPCLSAPCLHNSTCVILSQQNFHCVCQNGYIGVYCEIQQNLCESNPCSNNGVCVTKANNEIQCLCPPVFSGKFCEQLALSQLPVSAFKCKRQCQNGGLCLTNEHNEEECICKQSFTGVNCELIKPTKEVNMGQNCSKSNDKLCMDPCVSNPCLYNGTCSSAIHNYTCSCDKNRLGIRCEIESQDSSDASISVRDSSHDDTTDLWPLAIVFGYVFSLMLVFIIIWFLWYGLTIRPSSSLFFRSDLRFDNHRHLAQTQRIDRLAPSRIGVANPLFFHHSADKYSPSPSIGWTNTPRSLNR
ncbi:unnamed protein product [Didymodactylos carnosus]|uniref:EGF-like domain-containing protein n=2 Tax=Didymodactylos carnosus TaxID=1234261 RepID=A0A8S2ITX1_9BILA|nr:unnamed protein product [Didymodactylos carnosus]CAF3760514.1 unnamed protein product [Didymodactylos carnosus]